MGVTSILEHLVEAPINIITVMPGHLLHQMASRDTAAQPVVRPSFRFFPFDDAGSPSTTHLRLALYSLATLDAGNNKQNLCSTLLSNDILRNTSKFIFLVVHNGYNARIGFRLFKHLG
jgi:hypothetical protein